MHCKKLLFYKFSSYCYTELWVWIDENFALGWPVWYGSYLGSNPYISQKISKGHKQRSGQQTLARQKIIQKKYAYINSRPNLLVSMTGSKLCTENKNRKRSFKPSTRVQQGRRHSYSTAECWPGLNLVISVMRVGCAHLVIYQQQRHMELPKAHTAEKLQSG